MSGSLTVNQISYLCAALVLGYGFGSVPFGLVLTKMAGTPDLRSIGSGNIGATNVLRTGRKGLAAATLALDMLKATGAIVLAGWAWGSGFAPLMAALGAFLGHLFPVWLNYKGGKGVATYLGCLLGLAWPVALIFALVWLLSAYLWRYSSLAALMASALSPLALVAFGQMPTAVLFFALTLLVWWKHSENISRLMSGQEGKIGQKA